MKGHSLQSYFIMMAYKVLLVRVHSTEASLFSPKGSFMVITYGHFIFIATACILLSVAKLSH